MACFTICAAVKCKDVQYLYCPQYEGLSIDALVKEATMSAAVTQYLPDAKDMPRLPRQWLVNVFYTVL